MRYPASETAEKHARALQAAARLFRERGFDGASISEIMAATGLTHGSFYNHFDSKEELLAEAFEHASQEALAVVEGLEKSREGRQSMYRDYLSAAHRDRPGEGCIMAALATDFQTQPKARGVVTRHIQRLITKFGEHFPWPRRRNARQEAIRALASMVGGVIPGSVPSMNRSFPTRSSGRCSRVSQRGRRRKRIIKHVKPPMVDVFTCDRPLVSVRKPPPSAFP